LEKDYRKNLLKRFFTSLVILFPIAIIINIESILLFSVLIFLVCIAGFFEWINNRLGNNFLGIFLISSFGISSIIFVDSFVEKVISAYLVFLLVILNTAIYFLEFIVCLVQAYVFSLLSAVFIGMAIHADH